MNNKKPFLSIIIPVFNEEQRIHNVVQIQKYLEKKPFVYEIIIINDGSFDKTLALLKKIKKELQFKIISYNKNKGKGYAIRQGMLASKGTYRLFTDIDLSTPIKEFDKFIPHLNKNDIIIATRKKKTSILIKRQPLLRENLGKIYTLLSKTALRITVSDFTCGFKCFSEKAAKNIFRKQKIDSWGFDSEILFLAKKNQFKIKEITVRWMNDPRTKVKFPRDIINSLYDLTRIIFYDLRKIYNR